MKKWLRSLFMVILVLPVTIVHAESPNKPDPNIYEKQDIEFNLYIRERLNRREEISEQQQMLQFNQWGETKENESMGRLTFLPQEVQQTVIRKSQDAHLFTSGMKIPLSSGDEEKEISGSFMKFAFIVLVIFIIGLLVLIVPRLSMSDEEDEGK